jgi:Lipoprotein LpqB beta-propeller domain/Sporulation and spore germination
MSRQVVPSSIEGESPAGGRRPATALAIMAVAASSILLGGCGAIPGSLVAQVPTSGPIEQGAQLSAADANQFIRVIARGPREGMTPAQVVQGFLDASASFDGDHAVARQYLTRQASQSWDAGAGVVVYEGIGTLTSSASLIDFTASLAGEIEENGHYSVADSGAEVSLKFTLTRVDGQWRISRLPPGLVLSISDVDRAFRSLDVYFFDPSFTILVPDPRMIPVIGPAQATTLVRYLMDGPSQWLEPAVRTGFPEGLTLAIESVPVESGVAKVSLSARARLLGDSSRRALSEQLIWTLRQVQGVSSVDITSGSLPLTIPGVPSPQPVDAWPAVDPGGMPPDSSAVFDRDGIVVRSGPGGTTAVPGQAGSGEVPLTELALDAKGARLAGLDSKGTLWSGALRANAVLTPLLADRRLASPAFDRSGAIWAVDSELGLVAVAPDGTVTQLPVQGLPKDSVLMQAVPSRDGTRVALVVQDGPRRGLLLARIVRPTLAGTVQVNAPIRVESRLTEVLDVTWSGPDLLAVIGSDGAGSPGVFEVSLARASIVAVSGPAEPASIAAAPRMPTLVAASDGLVYALGSGAWRSVGPGRAPAYPG